MSKKTEAIHKTPFFTSPEAVLIGVLVVVTLVSSGVIIGAGWESWKRHRLAVKTNELARKLEDLARTVGDLQNDRRARVTFFVDNPSEGIHIESTNSNGWNTQSVSTKPAGFPVFAEGEWQVSFDPSKAIKGTQVQ